MRAVGAAERRRRRAAGRRCSWCSGRRQTRNEQAQAEAALGGWSARRSGWSRSAMERAGSLQELGVQRGQVAMIFGRCDGATEAAGG